MEDEGRLNVSSDFGNLLRRLRLDAGLSQEALAERARMSINGIGALERGYRRHPQRETVALLCEALALDGERRCTFEDAARSEGARHFGGSSATASQSFDSALSNLPRPLTSFVGRDRDVAEIKALLQHHRLLTVTGSGGVGKTRIAIRVGEELIGRYPDGVWFADLAPINDRELVASVVGQALGISQQQGHRVDESIPRWLKRKKLLLVFDNCEHLLDPVAALTHAILTTARDVRILATSRQRIQVNGEMLYRLPSLAVPAESADLAAVDASRYGAVALFVDRVSAADSRFVLGDNSAPIVSEICRRLDGIPLAIELAAAGVTVLSIPNLARRLDERFQILTGGNRLALPRHQTLTALIDWSYDLLASQEQLLFERLGVFAGGFDLDAVAAVCCGKGIEESGLLDLLASLIDKSLVIANTSGERERFRLLESTAAYAREKLGPSGERDRDRLARQHAEYFRAQAQDLDVRYGLGSSLAWLADAERELDDFRAALVWTLTRENDPVLGGSIAGALDWLWWHGGLVVEGRYWIDLALPRVDEAEHAQIAGRLQLALSLLSSGKYSLYAAERALRLFESVGAARSAARARQLCAVALFQMGRFDEAHEAISSAAVASRACEDMWSAAHCLVQYALIELNRGNLGAGRDLYAQALAELKALGDEWAASTALGGMAEVEFAMGDPAQALRLANEALDLLGRSSSERALWNANRAIYRIALGDIAGASGTAREGLRLAQRLHDGLSLTSALHHIALLAALDGDARCGAKLLGYVDVRFDRIEIKRGRTEQWGYDKLLATMRQTLSDEEIEKLKAEGAAWSEDRAIEEALRV